MGVENPSPEALEDSYVALLRGINVGGRNVLAMRDLADLFIDRGCGSVRTYIQSGNVIFRAEPGLARRIPEAISDELCARFDLTVPVVIRTADELVRIVEANPFAQAGREPRTLHVAFLRDAPNPSAVARLDDSRSSPDEFAVIGNEIYLHLPNGVARTKLTVKYFDATLETTSTIRNWRTVLKLRELVSAAVP